MKKIKANLIKLLSGLSLAAFFVGAIVNMTPITVFAQSHESENDTEGPIINSAISDGRLVVEAYDDSGVAAIYVNDYEFTDVPDGVLSIRLQQFDSGYEQFRLSAIDTLGNESFDYYIDNPYFDTGDEEQENPAKDLPVNASPSGNTEAKADVTDYTEVRGDDGSAKLFYTFETESGKVFYLIIDRTLNFQYFYHSKLKPYCVAILELFSRVYYLSKHKFIQVFKRFSQLRISFLIYIALKLQCFPLFRLTFHVVRKLNKIP